MSHKGERSGKNNRSDRGKDENNLTSKGGESNSRTAGKQNAGGGGHK